MKNVRLTASSDEGKWVYCVDSPDEGERVSLSHSELAEAVHATHWSDKGSCVYIERVKSVVVGEKNCIWMSDGEMFSRYTLLKTDDYYWGGTWLLEIRSVYHVRYVEGADNEPLHGCKMHGPFSLKECFKILLEDEMIGDLVKVDDSEVYSLAKKYFCRRPKEEKKKSWFQTFSLGGSSEERGMQIIHNSTDTAVNTAPPND